jgi:IS5 family transposase
MRQTVHDQLRLTPVPIAHAHALELRTMSATLDALPEIVKWVHDDLIRRAGKRIDPKKGRRGMTAEQVLRALIVKQMNGFSYEQLAFHLADSSSYRAFCRLGFDEEAPKKSRLQSNIKRVRALTWERINHELVRYAAALHVETGQTVRADCTVVESNIHHPTDSSLLWDCVRVLVRWQARAQEMFGVNFTNHKRRARRRALGVLNAKSNEQRLPLYRDLLKVTEASVSSAKSVTAALGELKFADLAAMLQAATIADQLRNYSKLAQRVIEQTRRRVLLGEQVPAGEKVVSIFEPHTDIIVKDRRETLYGHKICLTSGASGLVTDVVVEEGNPADSTLAVKMIERHYERFGKAPRQVCFDGGFASKANLAELKALGVQDVAFSKHLGLSVTDMVKSSWVYKRLRNFRAGIEGTISFVKRIFGLDRCAWSGFASFRAYVHGSVLACNLLVLARHLLASSA